MSTSYGIVADRIKVSTHAGPATEGNESRKRVQLTNIRGEGITELTPEEGYTLAMVLQSIKLGFSPVGVHGLMAHDKLLGQHWRQG